MKRLINIALASIIILLSITSCTGDLPIGNEPDTEFHKERNNVEVVKVDFSDNYKNIHVKIKVPSSISIYSLNDTTKYHFETEEATLSNKKRKGSDLQPVLANIKNIHQQELARTDFRILLLVDLTMPQENVQKVKENIQQMRRWFAPSNLYISFMHGQNVSESMPLTDYIMDNYFKRSPTRGLLYRSMLEKLKEIESKKSFSRDQKALVVFSDGDVYDAKDLPIDPQHFELQEQLLHINSSMGYSPVEYINYGTIYEEGESNEAKGIITALAKHTGGIYLEKFDWSKLLVDILNKNKIDYSDYELEFINPNNKVYVGKTQHLSINIYDGHKLLGTGCAEYSIGSAFSPVIINGMSKRQAIFQGCLIALLVSAIAYFILQIIFPYFSFKYFKRKYVTHYTKEGMIFNGIPVGQSCYYCKAPFEEGDEIVVKCKHVVHKECWDENLYKCPESGRRCKEGSHYYNAKNLLDEKNAPFYIYWVIGGILAGLIGWITFVCFMTSRPSGEVIYQIMLYIRGLKAGTPEAQMAYDLYIKHLTRLPMFGLCLNLFLTFSLSYLSQHSIPFQLRYKWAIAKALVCGTFGYFTYLVTCMISVIFDMKSYSLFIDWIPWIANGFIIAIVSTHFTRIKLRKRFIAVSCIVGFGMMYVWTNLMFSSVMDNREELLLCFLVYSIAMSVSLAVVAPKSEQYFLHVEGVIKPTDIALYKWLRTSPDYKVSIGKSVDCNLQITWDYSSEIAPLQATITNERGKIYLTAEEEGVIVDNQPMPRGSRLHLFHGKKFTIGKNTFTYLEKDI